MMTAAWNNGLDARPIPSMTPSEARGYFETQKFKNIRDAANADRLAWLIGAYMMAAFHAPKKYPKKPRNAEKIEGKKWRESMSDAQMLERMMRFAGRVNGDNGKGNGCND